MDKFILDISKLQPGDIILERLTDRVADKISRLGHTQHTHAMLYVTTSSVIEAMDDIVISNNPAREIFKDPDHVSVLRVKPEYACNVSLDTVVAYARQRVGNQYSIDEAKRIINQPPETAIERDRQTCTRLVAKAYEEGGLKIVENTNYCVPQEILESDKMFVVEDTLKEATEEDIAFIESKNILKDQHSAFVKMFARSREILGESFVQDESSLNKGVSLHPEKAHEIAEAIKESGYLNLITNDKKLHPWDYASEQFIKYYRDKSFMAALQLVDVYNDSKDRFKGNIKAISSYIDNFGDNEYYSLMRNHYAALCKDCDTRLDVLLTVRTKLSE